MKNKLSIICKNFLLIITEKDIKNSEIGTNKEINPIDWYNISEACLHIYWKQGINNISYNDVIKTSNLSKGSYYKLFVNEDDLHSETLITYSRNNDVNLLFHEISNAEDLFQVLSTHENWKFKNGMKYCYFFAAYLEKYRVGIKTRKTISNTERKYKLLLSRSTKKHIEKYDIKKSAVNINQIVNFVFNGFVLINLLNLNKSSKASINSYKKSLYQFISNLSLIEMNV